MSNDRPASSSLVNGDQRSIGRHAVGPIAFGCWRMTGGSIADSQATVEAALDAGCTLVDTADVYGLDWGGSGFGSCEEQLGKVLAAAPHLRERMVLATKGGIRPPVPYDSSHVSLSAACENSLTRLGVDHVDLYQIHRPDLFAHPDQVADTLASLVHRGLVGSVGVSNYTPAQTRALQAFLPFPLATTQPQWSAAHLAPMRDGTADLAMQTGLTVLAWSPLAGGRLATGEQVSPHLVATLDRLAAREGVSRTAVAIAFVLAHPSQPVAIIGTQRRDRIAEACTAIDVQLDRTDVYEIVQASDGQPLP
jgi:predicted oxidoreductase